MIDMQRLSLHPFYPIWNAMIARCNNPKNPSYKNYGAIDITVCEQWMPPKEEGFLTFLKDMVDPHLLVDGDYLSDYFFIGKSLDRRFGAAGYNPENCRWVSSEVQNLNRRSAVAGRLLPQGVRWRQAKGRFQAYYTDGKKNVTIGSFTTLLDAVAARKVYELRRYAGLGVECPQ
jgi:hypothetical protein